VEDVEDSLPRRGGSATVEGGGRGGGGWSIDTTSPPGGRASSYVKGRERERSSLARSAVAKVRGGGEEAAGRGGEG
jgi:hypothetical protein